MDAQQFAEELNRYNTPDIMRELRMSAPAVEKMKSGQDTDAPCQRTAVIQVLSSRLGKRERSA